MQSVNSWLRIFQPRPQARLRLFCLPYAGGAASVYRTWHRHLPSDVEVCSAQLPGHGERWRERPLTNLVELVQAMLPHLLSYLDKPFALFGHSMGAPIAYELAQQLFRQWGRTPTHLLVSSRRAPHLPEPEGILHTLPGDEAFLAELQRRYFSLPEFMFEDAEARELFVGMLRADLTLVETYQCLAPTPLPCPVVVFGGESDPRTSPAELRVWQTVAQDGFALHLFPGGHFYLNEQLEPLLATIAGYLGTVS